MNQTSITQLLKWLIRNDVKFLFFLFIIPAFIHTVLCTNLQCEKCESCSAFHRPRPSFIAVDRWQWRRRAVCGWLCGWRWLPNEPVCKKKKNILPVRKQKTGSVKLLCAGLSWAQRDAGRGRADKNLLSGSVWPSSHCLTALIKAFVEELNWKLCVREGEFLCSEWCVVPCWKRN